MRKSKPATSSGPACHRCTAVLFTGVPRCGMCGWPAGVGYPPADGELDQATSPDAASPESSGDEPDHVGVQLDALVGMVARQGQALSPVTGGAETQDDAAPEAPVAPDVHTAEAEEPTSELPPESDQTDEAPAQDNSSPAEEIDPLTAPLAALTGGKAAAEEAASISPEASIFDSIEPVSAPEPAPERVADAPVEVEAPVATPVLGNTRTAGRTAAILRPAQLLIVATAALNLVLVGLNATLGTPSGSMAMVVLGAALITLAVWTGAAVTFLHWISRAHAHVAATTASRQRHGPSMSLIGWFIPIAGFVIGYRVLQDLWTGSDPATRQQTDAGPAKVRSIDIWLLGIVTAALFGYVMPLALGESALWAGLSALGLMVAALSLVSIMGAISAWQLEQGDVSVADEAVAESAGPSKSETDESAASVPAPEPVSASAE